MHRGLLLRLVLFSAPVLSAATDVPNGAARKEEIQKLQGIWQVTKFIENSEEAPADEIKECTFEFQGNRLTIRKRKDDEGRAENYTVNPSKKPKWIDIDVFKGSSIGQGIYKLEGDLLTICVVCESDSEIPTPRPSEFKAKKKGHSLFVLKKAKK